MVIVAPSCCDLLSFLEFMIFATTRCCKVASITKLWFAFVLWIYDICHNPYPSIPSNPLVVICFRSLNLWYLPQLNALKSKYAEGCDLLSFFEFMIFATTLKIFSWSNTLLWFAFVLWIYDICHNSNKWPLFRTLLWFAFVLWIYDICHNSWNFNKIPPPVVICFRSLNLWYLPQLLMWIV